MTEFFYKTRRGVAYELHVSFFIMETKLLSIPNGEYFSRSLFRYTAHNAVLIFVKVLG